MNLLPLSLPQTLLAYWHISSQSEKKKKTLKGDPADNLEDYFLNYFLILLPPSYLKADTPPRPFFLYGLCSATRQILGCPQTLLNLLHIPPPHFFIILSFFQEISGTFLILDS